MDIPVYLVAGFLDSGKTDFINGILEDGFANGQRTLLICCEEGELEYNPKALKDVTVVTVEDESELTCSFLKQCEKKYRPKQVLIEYNGMWMLNRLYEDVLPANWVLYQVMTFVQASTFELYAKNMGGGSVNPLTGDFNFAVSEGYIVRNGKICEPVRGASLIGNGSQNLMDIDMVGQNLATGQGMCGSASGSVPTDVGQPLIRVSSITVGGR